MKEIYYRLINFCPTPDKLVTTFDFGIGMNKDIARKLKSIKITEKDRENFQKIAREQVLEISGFKEKNPYSFFEDTLLIKWIYLDRGKNIWLGDFGKINYLERDSSEELTWSSSNVDNKFDAYTLGSLFTRWTHYAEVFLKE